MALAHAFDIVFAVGVVVSAAALALAALRRASVQLLAALTTLVAVAAVADWICFALRGGRELAISAGGLTGSALAAAASLLLNRGLAHAESIDARIAEARATLQRVVDREAEERGMELERTLARARADSLSLLVEEERRVAEARRGEFAEREREGAAALTKALTATQAQVEQRVAAWTQDLDRAAEATKLRMAELAHRQKQLLSEVELRLAADADRLGAEGEEQRAALVQMRSELGRAVEESLAAARADLETHALERRRALHELDERMRRRERELLDRIEREETEAVQRIRAGFEDVGRRQLDQMQRIVERSMSTYADEVNQQLSTLIKSSREDAARRLARELERAVEVFARQAESVLAERLAHVGDAGAQRLERRLAEAAKRLERQRDEWMTAVDGRIAELLAASDADLHVAVKLVHSGCAHATAAKILL